ncbi:uncharacterized protein PV06_03733 [Exophiala oligosperma]|uniref:Nucleoporin Nup159/Nup146 N-terminal domain-containing protein n=1 Tax=Exophiala oligosperma TaxID=215243 RepID=A0A0D2DS84_9EURO|nr:uncharacterized protein PV06_03733 [Exophiala oligosperma]KIW45335.1 hypothetical protein PV06_03733 [Exophiala oligosperma]
MAFSFASAASAPPAFGTSNGGGNTVQDGPELQEIQTNELGLAALNGEAKVRLLTTPWPSDALPAPSSSLLSIASSKKLLAAAGPDALYLHNTDKVRDAFQSPPDEKGGTIRSIKPDFTIPRSRLSHVAFSSDDSVLVVSGEREGSVAAFQVDSITKGELNPAVQVSTDSQNLRALVPNPVTEHAELFALILTSGDLVLLDLKAGSLVSGSNGPVLKSGCSCLSWSNRGKQLVTGMADGTAVQMKPDGTIVAQIPKSTAIPANVHVSGISWLENDTFFITYTPNDTSDGIQPSEYYIVNRQPKTSNYTFQKLPEVLPPFGLERLPTSHFIARLRNFPPHLQDLLIVASSTASDVGLLSKSEKALSQEDPVTSVFTYTTIEDDTRRAQLPLSTDMQDTSPIGMAVDLSSTEKVPNPIPSDAEILETAGPVPSLVILNNEGLLVSWWIIYNDSVRQQTMFSGFANVQAARGMSGKAASDASSTASPATGNFGQASNPSPFAKTETSSFGVPSLQSGFGATSPKSFGTSSPIASNKPSWATTGFTGSATSGPSGNTAFGAATPLGSGASPAFGSASAIGARQPAFGQSSNMGSGSAFGQPSAIGAPSTSSPFANAGGSSNSSGFASFSKGSGFASFAGGNTNQNTQSPFSSTTGMGSFGGATPSPFAATGGNKTFDSSAKTAFGSNTSTASPFGSTKPTEGAGLFGNAGAFKLQSSFQGDGTATDDLPKPKDSSGFGFGAALDDMLGGSKSALSPTHDKEAEMDEQSAVSEADSEKETNRNLAAQPRIEPPQTLVTPPSTLSQSKATPAPPLSNLFGQPAKDSTTPQAPTSTPGWSFGLNSTTPKETPAVHKTLFGTTTTNDPSAGVQKSQPMNTFGQVEETPRIKEEPPSDEESVDMENIPQAPLPPDPVSKPRYASGDTSGSSNLSKGSPDEAPLPPDFLPVPKAGQNDEDRPELPSDEDEDEEDDFSSDFEGSGEELTGDVGPEDEMTEEQHEQLQTSPESSFKSGGGSLETSPTGGLFTKVTSKVLPQKSSRPLFGEVGTGPIFAPPKPHESPRSPSPVRHLPPTEKLRAESARSVSAPAHGRSIVDQRKAEYQKSTLAAQAAKTREEEAAKEQARREAIARQKVQAEAEQLQQLEDDEDERLREELDRPISPSLNLDDFITYQPKSSEETSKTGIPAQIERLYSDINSMVFTLGINYRSLSAFLKYQQPEATNKSWPSVLQSETPMDALNDEWFLTDISRLHEGQTVLSELLAESQVDDFDGKVQQCQTLIGRDLFELRTKLTSIRKTIHALSSSENGITAPLSAEQASLQHDLRKAFTSVQTKLVQVEDCISVLRAKIAQSTPTETVSRRNSMLGRVPSQKKPTVEAVAKTVGKMMSMAEQRSADIDVLESQLKKMDLGLASSTISTGEAVKNPATPVHVRRSVNGASTPGSTGSIYHTPGSAFSSSARSTRNFRTSQSGGLSLISTEDKERWKAQARRRKEAASMLKTVLEEKRKRSATKA